MSATSVLEIDVQSAEFESFMKEFQQYQQALNGMPAEYQTLGKRMSQVFNSGAAGVKKMGDEAKKQVKSVGLFEKAWDRVAKKTKAIQGTVTALGKGINSMIPGLGIAGLLAGGLLGLPAALLGAFSVSQDWASTGRTKDMALGTSQGSRLAFANQFGTYGLGEENLASIQSEKTDLSKQGQLVLATGLNQQQAKGMDSAELMLKALDRIKSEQEHGNLAMARAIKDAAGINEGQFQNILAHSRQEMQQDIQKYRQQRGQTDTSDDAMKGAQDFIRQMGSIGNQFKASFFNMLVPLQKPIEGLAEKFQQFMTAMGKTGLLDKIIRKIGDGLTEFGDYINKPAFKEDMKSLIANISEFAKAIWDAIKFINNIVHPFSSDEEMKEAQDGKGGVSAQVKQRAEDQKSIGQGLHSAWDQAKAGNWSDAWRTLNTPLNEMQSPPTPNPAPVLPGAPGTVAMNSTGPGKYSALAGDSEGTAENTTGVKGMLARSIMQESHGNPNAQSSAGAQGYLQWMPGTAKQYGVMVGDLESEKAGWLKYYSHLMTRFHDARKAAAAYNWGEGNVSKAQSEYGSDWLSHAPAETQKYVNVVVNNRTGSDLSTGLSGQSYVPSY